MSSEIDVQLHSTGLSITVPDGAYDENLPGQVNLDDDEADTLRDLLNEAWLNRHGMQPVSIPAADIQRGDVIPSLGLTVWEVRRNEAGVFIFFYGGTSSLSVGQQLEITVHRRIE